jgi:hypothetical protein
MRKVQQTQMVIMGMYPIIKEIKKRKKKSNYRSKPKEEC